MTKSLRRWSLCFVNNNTMIYVCLVCLFLFIYYLFSKSYNYWESKNVPFEPPFLFFGSFYDVATRKKHIFEKVREIYNKHKTPYVGIHVFTQPYLLVRSPELIKKILVKDFDKFMNRSIATNEKVDPISYNTLFGAKDVNWKNIRTKITPVFTSGKMKLMLPLIKDCAEDLTTYLKQHNGETLDTRSVTKKFAVDVISSCAFGINSNCLKNEDSEIMKMATKLLDFNSFIRSISTLSFFFIPQFVNIFRLTLADKTASNYLINVFNSTLEERKRRKIVRNDLIDLLDNLRKNEAVDDAFKFDNIKMAAQAIIFFSAGNDTTSITISFSLYELALNKEIQEKLRQEVRKTFDEDGGFTYENIQEMKYLDMVLNETLRKYTLPTFLNRETVSDYVFEETGLKLEKGVRIMIPVAGLHYDPEYFPDPEKFNPERFINKNDIKPYTFLPFGDGPRNCIGSRFAQLVSKVALAYMIKDFAFEPTEATSIPLKFWAKSLLLQNEGGLYLKVIKI